MKALINHEIAAEFTRVAGIESVPLMKYDRLDTPVAAHPDMLFCILDNTVFCYEDYVLRNNLHDILAECGLRVAFVSHTCEKKYPNDIALNVLVMGKTLFCNKKHVAKEILGYASDNGYKVIDVKQGYSACSTLVIDENNAVTSDKLIAEAIGKENKRALLIKNDGIVLKGYNCGFIGGASGAVGKKIYFFGEIDTLENGQEMREFILDLGCEIFPVLSGRVYDFGGIKMI